MECSKLCNGKTIQKDNFKIFYIFIKSLRLHMEDNDTNKYDNHIKYKQTDRLTLKLDELATSNFILIKVAIKLFLSVKIALKIQRIDCDI